MLLKLFKFIATTSNTILQVGLCFIRTTDLHINIHIQEQATVTVNFQFYNKAFFFKNNFQQTVQQEQVIYITNVLQEQVI